jgi:hypothetical protein
MGNLRAERDFFVIIQMLVVREPELPVGDDAA